MCSACTANPTSYHATPDAHNANLDPRSMAKSGEGIAGVGPVVGLQASLTLSGFGPPEIRVPGPFAPARKLVVSLNTPLHAKSTLSGTFRGTDTRGMGSALTTPPMKPAPECSLEPWGFELGHDRKLMHQETKKAKQMAQASCAVQNEQLERARTDRQNICNLSRQNAIALWPR
eukprot:1148478-Pelagomonas_calceolata.AAC.1